VDPEKLIGFDTLWKIILESANKDITDNGVEIIYAFYSVNFL
jgi:hypothetical protein